MATRGDDQFHQDKSFSKGDAPRPGGEPDETLEDMGEYERPMTADQSGSPRTTVRGTHGPKGVTQDDQPEETVDEAVAGRYLDPLPDRHRPKGDDPEGTMADWNRGEGRA